MNGSKAAPIAGQNSARPRSGSQVPVFTGEARTRCCRSKQSNRFPGDSSSLSICLCSANPRCRPGISNGRSSRRTSLDLPFQTETVVLKLASTNRNWLQIRPDDATRSRSPSAAEPPAKFNGWRAASPRIRTDVSRGRQRVCQPACARPPPACRQICHAASAR
ncbi:hypothetical protein WR30_19410 [Burkholderia contaminans FFH2055]|nr:hypothetical protein WR30_19410 [Burkholderia contaminans FFH2055]